MAVLAKKVGIDLGTAATRLHMKGDGIVAVEPSIAAVEQGPGATTGRAVAIGSDAHGVPLSSRVTLRRPLRDACIDDRAAVEGLLQTLVMRACGRQRIFRPDVMVAVPAPLGHADRCFILEICAQAGARRFNNLGIQSQALRDVNSRRRAGDANLELIGGLQGGLVEANRRVHYSCGIGAVNFQRGVVRRNHEHATDSAEVIGDGDCEGRTFFRIGGGAQLVEQYQRLWRGGARNEINVGDVRRKCREILLDGLVIANIGQNRIEHR